MEYTLKQRKEAIKMKKFLLFKLLSSAFRRHWTFYELSISLDGEDINNNWNVQIAVHGETKNKHQLQLFIGILVDKRRLWWFEDVNNRKLLYTERKKVISFLTSNFVTLANPLFILTT